MDKKTIIVLILSLLLLLFYPYYLKSIGLRSNSKFQYVSPKKNVALKQKNDTVTKNDTVKKLGSQPNDTVYDTVMGNESSKIVLNTKTGIVKEVVFKEGKENKTLYPFNSNGLGIFMPTVSTVSFALSPRAEQNDIVLKGEGFRREYILRQHILSVVCANENEVSFFLPAKYKYSYRAARYIRILIVKNTGERLVLKPGKLLKKAGIFQNIDWWALSFRYYSIIFDPQGAAKLELTPAPEKKGGFLSLKTENSQIRMKVYIGPNSRKILSNYGNNWPILLNYGLLNNAVQGLLAFFYKITHNFGWAIILIAMIFNLLFAPLSLKSFKSMKQMQKLQPQMAALKEKYKNDPQGLNKEMLLLYKKQGVNPMSGCLPMLLQLPVFIALYNTLMRSYELKNASFLWIKDLAAPDRLFLLPKSLPFIGNEVNLLPILMAGLMYLQQKISPTSKASSMNLWFLPLIFGFIFYKFPAGLVLYWFTNSLFMFILQMARK